MKHAFSRGGKTRHRRDVRTCVEVVHREAARNTNSCDWACMNTVKCSHVSVNEYVVDIVSWSSCGGPMQQSDDSVSCACQQGWWGHVRCRRIGEVVDTVDVPSLHSAVRCVAVLGSGSGLGDSTLDLCT